MKKPKIIINLDKDFDQELREELQEYKNNGTLQEYGVTYPLEKGYKKVNIGDIIAFNTNNNWVIYFTVFMVGIEKFGLQVLQLRYFDFKEVK
ncbi:MAG: hypothetical protein NC222_06920 [Staphylococcus sp.]|nr:hypothetical protein [Staphylococcus sp.]